MSTGTKNGRAPIESKKLEKVFTHEQALARLSPKHASYESMGQVYASGTSLQTVAFGFKDPTGERYVVVTENGCWFSGTRPSTVKKGPSS